MSKGFPSMTALLGLLALAGYQNRDKIAEMLGGATGTGAPPDPTRKDDPASRSGGVFGGGGGGGLGGGLGGLLGGASAGSLLGGGLSELLERFRQNGFGEAADSWVSTGPNRDLPPPQLEQAIGPDVLATLSQQTGLSRDELLARLSRELPGAVDKYTPDGSVPRAA
ncbi:MAG TPA: YidB family protein [Xanthobacteraceae bacterium]|nr:YidB family protein [Xanthobacteraceae bacterium]